jgi:signal transduction histidine kinase
VKIRNRLSLQFTALVASVLLIFCVIIYSITATQVRNDFFDELYDRTLTTAYIFLEEDEFSPHIYELIRERYIRSLPGEIAQLFDMQNQPEFLPLSQEVSYSDELINYIRDTEFHTFSKDGRQAVGIFYRDNQGDFVVIVSAVNTAGQVQLYNLTRALVAGYFICVAILFLAGRFFAAQSLRPIPRVVQQVNAITPDKLDARLDDGGNMDEISELANTFNNLLDRLQGSILMQQRFVANASHELRTPLTSVIGEVEVTLSKARSTEEYEEVLRSIHHDALMLHELINGLLQIAQTESEKLQNLLEKVRIDELVLEAGMLVEKKYPGASVQVNYADGLADMDVFIMPAPKALLLNVFVNVIDNAIKFSPENPRAAVQLDANADDIRIVIRDEGIGIPAEEQERVFDPFYRADSAITYGGYGIGLSLVKRVVTLLGGQVTLASEHDKGTSVTVFFKKSDVLMPF